jgi:hypothetical protein
MNAVPFPLNKRAKCCQVCHYELKNPKWKGVVLCPNHRVHLCTESSLPRALSEPKLYMVNGREVTDFSWTFPDEGGRFVSEQNLDQQFTLLSYTRRSMKPWELK